MTNSLQLSYASIRAIYKLLLSAIVFGVLYFAQDVLIPVMLSVLIAFVVAPLMFRFEKLGISRLSAVLMTSSLVFLFLGALIAVSGGQLWGLVRQVPTYQQNLMDRVALLRPSGNSSFSKAMKTIGVVEKAIDGVDQVTTSGTDSGTATPHPKAWSSTTPQTVSSPTLQPGSPINVRIVETATSTFEQLGAWINPILGPLGTAGLVIVLVIFILLDLDDLHQRFIRLTGDAVLPRSNIAVDDAIARVSSYIRLTFLINAIYGVAIGIGLYLIGIPNALLWCVLGAVLRVIPYLGPLIVFLMPFGLSLAAVPGWMAPLLTLLLFGVLELVLNNVIEPWLYGKSTGVSSMGIILASIFWAWLWGPVGLILATPLTVILVSIGRHFPQFQFMTTLFAEKDAFQAHDELFQRLMMDDLPEAQNIAERFCGNHTLQEACDQLYLPTLSLVENHRRSQRLTSSASEEVCRSVVEISRSTDTVDYHSSASTPIRKNANSIVIIPERNSEDRAASELIQHVLSNYGYSSEILNSGMLTGELTERLADRETDVAVLSSMGNGRSTLAMTIARRLARTEKQPSLICGLWDCVEIRKSDRDFLMSHGITRHVTDAAGLLNELSSETPDSSDVSAAVSAA